MILKLNKINKSFDFKQVLNDVNLRVKKNELMYLSGFNGSGKTTLLKVIAGILNPESGSIFINESKLKKNSYEYKSKIIYWGHQPMVYPNLTPRENLSFFLKLRSQAMPDDIDTLFEEIGLIDYKDRPCYKLSRGMFQKYNLLKCSVAKWSLALIDEPMSGMDTNGREFFLKLLKEWVSNKTVIFTSHQNTDLNKLATTHYSIVNKKLIKI